MSKAKSKSLPAGLKSLITGPTFTLLARASVSAATGTRFGRAAGPAPAPKADILHSLFEKLDKDAAAKGVGWGEWMSLATATLFTLNSSGSLQSLHRYTTSKLPSISLADRVSRACLMREVGLKCIGFIGIPKVINNLAAVRAAVEEDQELAAQLPTEPRRRITSDIHSRVNDAAYELWDDIYQPHSKKLLGILGKSHPDLPVFIVESEYGPLFQTPSSFHPQSASSDPDWEVNRLRTSLVAIASLRAQGGVGPQVTSHVWGLMKAAPSIAQDDPHKDGLQWLATEQGAEWVLRSVTSICETIEGASEADLHQPGQETRESKL
ncbi:hypothetical protein K437DRAFT_257629 [Tilletiaria anomala UBC 951]|uniref:Uncharacterized protein n=1 Tax=Tilletiaria anomala (strain ATCC 24038 / CBS 436.72 / UBC 951) TaxID=1037660 RepID=A0A066VX22_TILAU|nr:uncharacterized protein K437DRAFT_257629 [Tilletiaria anomala UBC 951]KDN43105.1 hypothetical protein K437DRAFT_257629 [Tilletiaria anomala UBC 951]